MSYGKFQQRADFRGMDLRAPVDSPRAPRTATFLKNVRRNADTIRNRPGLNSFIVPPGAVGTAWHSIRRLNDPASGASILFHGISGEIFTSTTAGGAFTSRGGGYSGIPLSMIPFRPQNDVRNWMAFTDGVFMYKINTSGTLHPLGLNQPSAPPTCELDPAPINILVIDEFEATAGWVEDATHAATTALATTARVNTTITLALRNEVMDDTFDAGSRGWYTIVPVVPTAIGRGMRLWAAGGFGTDLHVYDVFHTTATTTIANVIFDPDGVWATIALTTRLEGLRQGAFLGNIGLGNYSIVYAVIEGLDGEQAVRIKRTNWALPAVGDTLQVVSSFLAHSSSTANAPSGALTSTGVELSNMTGQVVYNITRSGLALDLHRFSSAAREVDLLNDEMHISVRINLPDDMVEMKVMADVDNGTFDRNWYMRAIRPSDLTPIAEDRLAAIDARVQQERRDRLERSAAQREKDPLPAFGGFGRNADGTDPTAAYRREWWERNLPVIDPPGNSSSQTGTGRNQWHEVKFKMADFVKYGTDETKTLQNVNALRIQIRTKDSGPAIPMIVAVDSWYITGGYGTDVGNEAPYEYRYRARVRATGARSNWSPPSRMWVNPYRHSVRVCTGVYAPASISSGDVEIDFQRRGGTVNEWRTIGTVPHGTPYGFNFTQFTDDLSDEHAIAAGASLYGAEGNINAQPFSVIGLALGSVDGVAASHASVAGSIMQVTSAPFDTDIAPGTFIIVNKIPTLVYRVHSTSIVELFDNVGYATSCTWEIPEPVYRNQALPIIFGDGSDWVFGCGDTLNPGRLYFFNRGTLDSTQSGWWIDVAAGGSTLQNGCVYNGRYYLWSNDGMYVLSPDPETVWRADPIPAGDGLFARYALAVGDLMYWLGRDGIYASDGGKARLISDELEPLFPHGGKPGNDVYEVKKIFTDSSLTSTQRNLFRMSCDERYLYFVYTYDGTGRAWLTLDRGDGTIDDWGWWHDSYSSTLSPAYFYVEEGDGVHRILVGCANAPNARLYTLGGSDPRDDSGAFSSEIRTFAADAGDLRAEKLIGDALIDANPGGATLVPDWWFNSEEASLNGTNMTGASRTQTINDFGGGVNARNISLQIQWSVSGTAGAPTNPTLYGWSFSLIGRPDDIIGRATDFSTAGYAGPKHFRGVYIHAETEGIAKDVVVEYVTETGVLLNKTLSVNHSYKTTKYYTFDDPFIAMVVRLRGTDTDTWKLYEDETTWVYDQYPPITDTPTPWTNDGSLQCKRLYGLVIEVDTESAARGFRVEYDDITAAGATLLQTTTPVASQQHAGRTVLSYDITPPVLCHLMRINPNAASNLRIFDIKWLWDPWPEYDTFVPDFNDLGYQGPKHFRGVNIEADTTDPTGNAAAVDVQIQSDGGTVQQTISVNHLGRIEKPYVISPQFVAHSIRLVPLSPLRMFKAEWIYDQYPELAAITTAWNDGGFAGTKYIRGLLLTADTAGAPVNLEIRGDENVLLTTISINHNGQSKKSYDFAVPLHTHKIRLAPIGNARLFDAEWIFDQYPELDNIMTEWEDGGSAGTNHVRGLLLTADTSNLPVDIQIQGDEGAVLTTISVTHNGQSEKSYAFSPPLLTHKVRLVPQGNARIFSAKWIMDPYPELNSIWSEWNDGGHNGPKYLHGFILTGDTGGAPATVQLQGDDGTVLQNFTMTHSGQVSKDYSLTTPATVHNMRLVPTAGSIRFFNVQWLWSPEAPLGDAWQTQEWEMGDPYGFSRTFEVEYASTVTLTLTYYVDGVLVHTDNTTLVSTGGLTTFVRRPIDLPVRKGRLGRVRIEHAATQFRVREKGSTVSIKSFGAGSFQTIPVIGAVHGAGAPI